MTTPKRNEAVATTRHEAGFEDGPIFHREEWMRLKDLPKGTRLFTGETISALQGEVSRLRADAMRYRYLRDHAHPDSDEGFAVMRDEMNDWGKWYAVHVTGDALDAAIDALNLEPPTDGQ